MASKSLFKSLVGLLAPKADAVNEAGGTAYDFSAKHKLAQYAATGCLNNTFYVSADQQLAMVLELCAKNEPEFIAQVALFARSKGYMKDMPALLCAVLSVRSPGLLAEIFDRVIDSPKMLQLRADHAVRSCWTKEPWNSAKAVDRPVVGKSHGRTIVLRFCW